MIHNAIASVKIGASTAAVWLVGQISTPPIMTAGEWHITIATAGSVMVFCAALVWNLGRKMQKLEDGQEMRQSQINEIHQMLKSLPCQKPICPPEDKHRS